MATMPPVPVPDAQAAPPPPTGGADNGTTAPPDATQAPANPLQILLAKWSKVAEQMASSNPALASGAEKVREGIREMQMAMITPQQPTPLGQQPK